MPEVTCPNCGTPHPPNAQFCGQCGFPLPPVEATFAAPPRRLSPVKLAVGVTTLVGIIGLIILLFVIRAANPRDELVFPTFAPSATTALTQPGVIETTPSAAAPTSDDPTGKIVYSCQVHRDENDIQLCLINADGSGFRQLTFDSNNYYPSFAPDGRSIVFASIRTGKWQVYEMDLQSSNVKALTTNLPGVAAPEISPDGTQIVFTHVGADANLTTSIWLMQRDGSNPHELRAEPNVDLLDPSWSPDGTQIVYARTAGGETQLYVMNADGTDAHFITNMEGLRGRTDWSPDGTTIGTYAGTVWHRELYFMAPDGSNLRQIGKTGGNSLAPAFSPDSQWVVFTGYLDRYRDLQGCELYIMRRDGSDLRRLTDNDYCDYQPRWGP